jgi:hypothetical protein
MPVQSEIARRVRSEPFIPFTYFNACGRRGGHATNRQRLVKAAVKDWRARLEAEADSDLSRVTALSAARSRFVTCLTMAMT